MKITEVEVLGHTATTMIGNYGSLFSNIKAGIGISAIWQGAILMSYPPERDTLDASLIKKTFLARSKLYIRSKF